MPCADEVHHLQTGQGPEGDLFRKIAEQGHYAGRTKPTGTRQGIYMTAPNGVLLASVNTNDPRRMAETLEKALAQWKSLAKSERLLEKDPDPQPTDRWRWESKYPADGLVLRVHSRDLPRDSKKKDWRDAAWNQDFAWFTKEEALGFLDEKLPDRLLRRLARCSLVDHVRGQTVPYSDREIGKGELTAKVVKTEGDVVTIRLSGATRASVKGKWPVAGFADMNSPSEQTRGFEASLLGRATYDRKKARFTSFELVAVGTRWGGTQYNGRGDDLEPAPMGIALVLAGDTPSDRVAPAFVWAYGWK